MREGSIAMVTKRAANINYEFRVSFVLFADTMTSRIPISSNSFWLPLKVLKAPKKISFKMLSIQIGEITMSFTWIHRVTSSNLWRIPNGELVPVLMWLPGAMVKMTSVGRLPKGGLVRKKVEKIAMFVSLFSQTCDCKLSRWVIGISWYLYDILLMMLSIGWFVFLVAHLLILCMVFLKATCIEWRRDATTSPGDLSKFIGRPWWSLQQVNTSTGLITQMHSMRSWPKWCWCW